AKDPYTEGHSQRVSDYSLAIARQLDIASETINHLRIAGLLHDVGKIGVAGDLLRKPGPLDAGEEDMVRRHVDLSAAVINDMPRLARVAEAVQAHHEHHDGGGYPAEVSGDDIPILGRIPAIADAYSAMTLTRPYRKGLTPKQARDELVRAAGTQFDPDLVAKFIHILDAQADEPEISEAEAG
ncbi:MAG: HD domain-containing protein, partial [Thermoleophilia bacterium]|nr:HD domain-containing protein [Thermoleophilia bacterium]